MSGESQDPPPREQGREVAQKKLERFVKAFEGSSEVSAQLVEALSELAGVIDDERDGLITAIEVLVHEVRGLREDLRKAARIRGLGNIFGAFGG